MCNSLDLYTYTTYKYDYYQRFGQNRESRPPSFLDQICFDVIKIMHTCFVWPWFESCVFVTHVPHSSLYVSCLLFQLASCTWNKIFISATLFFSIAVSIVAVLPWVQKGKCVAQSVMITADPLYSRLPYGTQSKCPH